MAIIPRNLDLWDIFTDVKTAVWALTETLGVGYLKSQKRSNLILSFESIGSLTVYWCEMHAVNQGRTGINNRLGKFPDDLPPYRPSPGKIVKNPKSPFSHVKMTVFLLTPYWPTGHCPNASMVSPPLLPILQPSKCHPHYIHRHHRIRTILTQGNSNGIV